MKIYISHVHLLCHMCEVHYPLARFEMPVVLQKKVEVYVSISKNMRAVIVKQYITFLMKTLNFYTCVLKRDIIKG